MINSIRFRKHVRALAARLGIFRPLRALVIYLRGDRTGNKEIKFLERFLTTDDLVFDVGANRGQSSENYIKLGARVIAFEPQEDLHPEIRQLCRNSPRLFIESCGLGSVEETKRFFLSSYDQTASFRDDWESDRIGEKIIHVSTLDIKIKAHGIPAYCKIDVEGWELEVLRGLTRPIQIISFEYHLSPKESLTAKEVLARLAQLGSYFCNLKPSDLDDFLLEEFIPIGRFMDLFPERIELLASIGYGDIYCVLDPASIQRA